jgi:hypothetical protein
VQNISVLVLMWMVILLHKGDNGNNFICGLPSRRPHLEFCVINIVHYTVDADYIN